jgi:dCTP deaminase
MPVKSDKWIRKMALERKMIEPFADRQVREGVVSYGLSSYGYDFRVSDKFRIFEGANSELIDPKQFDGDNYVDYQGDICLVPANSYVIASTVEYFRIPRNIITICFGKSTYARCGLIVNITPFEPEWEGHATIGISNTAPKPARIYANEGIGQLVFLEADEICEVSYADKKGKYQAQKDITYPKIER